MTIQRVPLYNPLFTQIIGRFLEKKDKDEARKVCQLFKIMFSREVQRGFYTPTGYVFATRKFQDLNHREYQLVTLFDCFDGELLSKNVDGRASTIEVMKQYPYMLFERPYIAHQIREARWERAVTED